MGIATEPVNVSASAGSSPLDSLPRKSAVGTDQSKPA
jgi:hypothetical protein